MYNERWQGAKSAVAREGNDTVCFFCALQERGDHVFMITFSRFMIKCFSGRELSLAKYKGRRRTSVYSRHRACRTCHTLGQTLIRLAPALHDLTVSKLNKKQSAQKGFCREVWRPLYHAMTRVPTTGTAQRRKSFSMKHGQARKGIRCRNKTSAVVRRHSQSPMSVLCFGHAPIA